LKVRMTNRIVQIGRDSTWYLIAQAGYALMGLVSIPILTRVFSPSQYGIYSLVSITIVLVTPIFYISFTTSLIRFFPEYEKKGDLQTLYSTGLRYIPHFLAATLLIALPIAAFALPLGDSRTVVCLGIAIFALFVPFFIMLTLFQVNQKAAQYAMLFLIVYAGRYLVGAALAKWAGTGVNGIFIAWLGALLLVIPLELILLRIPGKFRWHRYSPRLMKEFFSYGFVLIFVNISVNILTSADRYMVQAFRGSAEVGLYSVVYTLVVDAFSIMLWAIQLGAAPVVMKTFENDGEAATQTLLSQLTRYLLILLIPSSIGLYLLRVRIISVLTSAKYLPSTKAVLPLVLGIFLYNLAWVPTYAFYVRKRTKLTLIPVVTAAIVNIGLNFWLIPKYGFAAAAWNTMIAYLVYIVILVSLTERLLHWEFPFKEAFKVLAASVVMGVGVFFLNKVHIHGIGALILMIVVGGAIYIAALVAFRGISRKEFEFARKTISRVLSRALPPKSEND